MLEIGLDELPAQGLGALRIDVSGESGKRCQQQDNHYGVKFVVFHGKNDLMMFFRFHASKTIQKNREFFKPEGRVQIFS